MVYVPKVSDLLSEPEDDMEEVEVTPEMIAAGVLELTRFHPDFQSYEDGAERIFRAMLEFAPSDR